MGDSFAHTKVIKVTNSQGIVFVVGFVFGIY